MAEFAEMANPYCLSHLETITWPRRPLFGWSYILGREPFSLFPDTHPLYVRLSFIEVEGVKERATRRLGSKMDQDPV
jgi:hypothetical protein